MIIRLMTLATVLMLLACLMIGATLALARSAHADDLAVTSPRAQDQNAIGDAVAPQADPDAMTIPYQPNLAASDQADEYNFDGLPAAGSQDDDISSYATLVSC